MSPPSTIPPGQGGSKLVPVQAVADRCTNCTDGSTSPTYSRPGSQESLVLRRPLFLLAFLGRETNVFLKEATRNRLHLCPLK